MKSVAVFSDDTDLRDWVNQLENYTAAYLSTDLDNDKLPNNIDLAIFDFDVVPLQLLDEWSQFPRLHLPKLAVVSVENLVMVDNVLGKLDNYIVRPMLPKLLQFRIEQVIESRDETNEYIGYLASDLKTPLTSIKGYPEVIRMSLDTMSKDEIIYFLQRIPKNANRILDIINLASDWVRIEYQKRYQFEQIEIMKLVYLVDDNARNQLNTKSQTLQKQIEQTLPLVYGDVTRIAFVFHAILDNASKYSDEKTEIQLTIGAKNGYIISVINDSGVGISVDFHEYVFEKFHRGNSRKVYEQYGQGLSLYLCKQIIEMHGGKIWFESELGVGTTFYFTLPLAK